MRTKITIYFIIGFLLQLVLIGNFAYWYTLLSAHKANDAVNLYAANFPEYMRDAKVILLAVAGITLVSMLCYGAARKLSADRVFRNLVLGLILTDAIVLVVIAIGLM